MAPLLDPVRDAESRVGSVLADRWRLDGVLGVGARTATFGATHRGGLRVAIKLLLGHSDSARARSFVDAAYVANAVGHPSVVAVLDDDVTPDGLPFVVSELLEGETVEARWSRSGFHLGALEVLWIAERLLDVLVVAHDKGIAHGRLRAANLFFTQQSALKVMDFGMQRLSSPQSQRLDPRADLRAVGAMMLALVSGRSALGPTSTRAPVPKPVADMIETALARDGTHEWLDAAVMRAAVQHAFETLVREEAPRPRVQEEETVDKKGSRAVAPAFDADTQRALAEALGDLRSEGHGGRKPPLDRSTVPDAARSAFDSDAPVTYAEPAVVRLDLSPGARGSAATLAAGGGSRGEAGVGDASAPAIRIKAADSKPPPPLVSELPKAATGAKLIFAGELAHIYFQRAMQREEAGDHAGAIEDYTRAIERMPGHALAHYNRGVARHAMGDAAGAVTDYDRALHLQPDLVDALYNASLAKWEVGDRAGARRSAEEAHRLYAARREHEMVAQAEALLARLGELGA